jgi:methylmalonyl-CoA/ethylmalonyl-CoA epimerase
LVREFDQARALLGGFFELPVAEPEPESDLGLEIMWVDAGDVRLELLRPTDPHGRGARQLDEGHGGVHHLAFTVDDIDETVSALAERGFRLRADGIRIGAHGSRICFLDPDDAQGMSIELVEPKPEEEQ